MEALSRLEMALQKQEQILCKALHTDLGKSKTESVMCEIGLAQFAAKSYQSPSPYGNVLIMSPWNYPVLLTLEPLVDAIAAGNTAVVKPSAYAPASANALKDLLEECFPPEYETGDVFSVHISGIYLDRYLYCYEADGRKIRYFYRKNLIRFFSQEAQHRG